MEEPWKALWSKSHFTNVFFIHNHKRKKYFQTNSICFSQTEKGNTCSTSVLNFVVKKPSEI